MLQIIIEGKTSYSIQGVGLREAIEAIVNTEGNSLGRPLRIMGIVKNIKHGRVEILCAGRDIETLYKEICLLKKNPLFDIKRVRRRTSNLDNSDSFDDFHVERSDDLSEMVWALRGAGNRFAASTVELKNLAEALGKVRLDLKERDKTEQKARLLALHYELVYNRDQLADSSKGRNGISISVLTANIQDPPRSEIEFLQPLTEVLFALTEFKNSDTMLADNDRVRELKMDISSLDDRVKVVLKKHYDIKEF